MKDDPDILLNKAGPIAAGMPVPIISDDDLRIVRERLAWCFRDLADYIDIALGEARTRILFAGTFSGSVRKRLYAIAKNKLLDECRRRRRFDRIDVIENSEEVLSLGDYGFERRELDKISAAELLAHLSAKQAEAMELCLVEGFSEKEAAGMLHISTSAVKHRLADARKSLRSMQHF